MNLTAAQFRLASAPHAKHHVIPDVTFAEVTDEMLAKSFDLYYGLLSGELLIDKYKHIDLLTWFKHHDCDNKALLLKVCVDAVYALYYAKDMKAEAPAFSYIHYMHGKTLFKKGSGHAINQCIHETKGEIQVEPQWIKGYNSNPYKKLNRHERKSIWLVGS